MNVAIMQPYFFPYLGYFQLAASVDKFVFLDDVSFIKKGFINRNSILLNSRPYRFTIPVLSVSQNKKINEHFYVGDFRSFLLSIKSAYSSSPYYSDVYPLVEEICLGYNRNVSVKNISSVRAVFDYLNVPFFYLSSSELPVSTAVGQDRIIEICSYLNASSYHNAMGGKFLYDSKAFNDSGIDLRFISGNLNKYKQGKVSDFVSSLSILDVLFFNKPADVRSMLMDLVLESGL